MSIGDLNRVISKHNFVSTCSTDDTFKTTAVDSSDSDDVWCDICWRLSAGTDSQLSTPNPADTSTVLAVELSKMAAVTIQVLEGLERGQLFENIATPITLGREDDNVIRLNDERVSRFHAKIQEDGDRIILTDLDSTNGTRVNGHPVAMRVLQYGDQVMIGRCLLVYGSNEQITERLCEIQEMQQPQVDGPEQTRTLGGSQAGISVDDERGELFPVGAPELPAEMQGVQRAQLSDVIAFSHDRIRTVLESAVVRGEDGEVPPQVQIDWFAWQRLLQLEMNLAEYLRRIAEPDG